MSQILSVKLNKFESVDGSRIGSRQVLYQSNLYNKHKLISWKCKVNKCNSTLNIDEENLNVIREPSKHIDHPEVTAVRVAVLQAINKMKVAAKEETTVDLKTIYNRYLKTLTDAKFLLNDISSINDGQLLPYVEFRSTLWRLRGSVVPVLPKLLADIDFDLPEYKDYTLTSESKLFLQYDNKKIGKRILIFMSAVGIDWLRE